MPTPYPESLKLDTSMQARIERIAEARHKSLDSVISEAVTQYVEREERRERFNNDTRAALSHYQETGLHLTGEETDAWLAKLEAGENIPPPPCHK